MVFFSLPPGQQSALNMDLFFRPPHSHDVMPVPLSLSLSSMLQTSVSPNPVREEENTQLTLPLEMLGCSV